MGGARSARPAGNLGKPPSPALAKALTRPDPGLAISNTGRTPASNLWAPSRGIRRSQRLAAELFLLDLILISVSALVATYVRGVVTVFRPETEPTTDQWAMVALWMLMLFIGGAYRAKRTGVGTSEYTVVLVWSLAAAGALAATLYVTSHDLSRAFFVLLFGIGIPALLAGRFAFRRLVHFAHVQGHLRLRFLVAGSQEHVDRVASVLARERWLGYDVIGALVPDGGYPLQSGIDVVGRPSDALSALKRHDGDGVIVAEGAFSKAHQFNQLARDFEDQGAQLIVVPTLADISAERVDIRPVAGLPLVFVEEPRAARARSWAKRAFDILGSTVLIALAAPLMALVALAIKLDTPGPALFRQRRVGLEGKEFDCLKFRSMVVDAEQRKRELEQRNQAAGVLFKLKDDPRVTRVGRLIRRLSLDELPQLLNVWTGRMSLVGPRPALPCEVARYEKHVLRRLDVRPGMTGLWQVSGRSDLSWEDTVRLDLYYVDNWSMLQDLNILARTAGAVVRSRGAY